MSIGPRLDKQQAKTAGEAIAAFLIVKKGTNEDDIIKATAGTDQVAGALQNANGVASGAKDARIPGVGDIGLVVLGDTVAAESYITADANSKAVATTTADNYVIGRVKGSGVAGDIIPYEHNPSRI